MTKVGIVVSGLVRVVIIDEGGDEHVLQLLHAGELVGDPLSPESAYSWEAATDVDLCWMPPATLAAIFHQNPDIQRGHLCAALRQVQEQRFAQVALRGRNALQRVAYWLSAQVPEGRLNVLPRIHILLTRRDLSSLLDMTVETLCRVLHQLDDQGAIRLLAPDLVELRDRDRLRILARDHDARVREMLLADGWEWGARTEVETARSRNHRASPVRPNARSNPGQPMTCINDSRQAI